MTKDKKKKKKVFTFSKRSLDNLKNIHPDLQAVAHLALQKSPIDFVVIEGVRTKKRQAELLKSGATRTMNSRHLTGHAIDVAAWVDGSIAWDWPLYEVLAVAFKAAAVELGVTLVWGGDWQYFKDGPHFELGWGKYPID